MLVGFLLTIGDNSGFMGRTQLKSYLNLSTHIKGNKVYGKKRFHKRNHKLSIKSQKA